jgi:hypothetical protein
MEGILVPFRTVAKNVALRRMFQIESATPLKARPKMAFNIFTAKQVFCFGQYDRIDDLILCKLRREKRSVHRQFLVNEFYFSAFCKYFDPLLVWHFANQLNYVPAEGYYASSVTPILDTTLSFRFGSNPSRQSCISHFLSAETRALAATVFDPVNQSPRKSLSFDQADYKLVCHRDRYFNSFAIRRDANGAEQRCEVGV